MALTPPKVKAILKKQKLIEIKNVSSHFHNYCSICLNKEKKLVYLKVRLYPKLVSQENFAKEVITNKFLSEKFHRNRFFIVPKYYNSELKKWPQWMIREYTAGRRMGDVWGFNPKFIKRISPKELADILDFIRNNISNEFKKRIRGQRAKLFQKWTSSEYRKYFLKYLILSRKSIGRQQREKTIEIFSRYKEFFIKNNNYLTHGDLHPGNVIYNKKWLVLHDWKYAHWDNPYFDFTFVWLLLWLNKNWRKKLFALELNRASSKEIFWKSFHLSVLELVPKMISIFMQASQISRADRKRGIKEIIKSFNAALDYLSQNNSYKL